MSDDWRIYVAGGPTAPRAIDQWLATAPPWRRPPAGVETLPRTRHATPASDRRGQMYLSSSLFTGTNPSERIDEEAQINIALMLRRPLLVSGPPGIGKSSLAYHLAWALGLGEPLRWEINSRATAQDGLYRYDAVDHLRAVQAKSHDGIGEFITLGPLGTAMLPTTKPRVLLVDEIDKASFDLPNDLLHVFEEGAYSIPELVRAGGTHHVVPSDPLSTDERVTIRDGVVRTHHHPVVVITSNGERELPPAFLRRCVPLPLGIPGEEQMKAIVRRQLQESIPDLTAETAGEAQGRYREQATDVILQALFVEQRFGVPQEHAERGLKRS